ncbi:MAG: hypothetical protein LLG06_12770 [Desulfobacteraceae bacterium]|nr:hypothetical protein [Desulfobacteraceae bacterium]
MSTNEMIENILQGENEKEYISRFVNVMHRYKKGMTKLIAALDTPDREIDHWNRSEASSANLHSLLSHIRSEGRLAA